MKLNLRSVLKQLNAAPGTDITKHTLGSDRLEKALDYLTAVIIGTSLAIILVEGLSK